MHFLLMSWRIEAVTLNVLIDPASQFYNQHKNNKNKTAAASVLLLYKDTEAFFLERHIRTDCALN